IDLSRQQGRHQGSEQNLSQAASQNSACGLAALEFMVTKKLHLSGSQEALLLLGQHDRNIRELEETYGVQIFGRAHILSVRGAPGKVENALEAIEEMREHLKKDGAGEIAEVIDPSEPAQPTAYTSAMGKSIKAR